MSYSLALFVQPSCTSTRWPAQLAGVPVIVRVKVSQVIFSTQFDSEFTFGPGFGGMPWVQEELGPPGAGPTEPEPGLGPVDGKVAARLEKCSPLRGPAPESDTAKSRAKPLMMKKMLRTARADLGLEDFLFICFGHSVLMFYWLRNLPKNRKRCRNRMYTAQESARPQSHTRNSVSIDAVHCLDALDPRRVRQ